MSIVTNPTLFDRLSRLTHAQALRLLRPNGAELLRRGGNLDIDIDSQVSLNDKLLRVQFTDVQVLIGASGTRGLELHCSACAIACEHMGSVLALLLEEKLALGLAAPPQPRQAVDGLTDEELVALAISERAERAASEPMRVQSSAPQVLWSDYLVTNRSSGKSYKVALRGWQPGDSYCSCPDFRKNTLGTCKHILHTLDKAKKKFSAVERQCPHQQQQIALHLRYGRSLELRLLLPENLSPPTKKLMRPLSDKPIDDLPDLLRRLSKLEAQGHSALIYPDAEEFIQQRLRLNHLQRVTSDIRADPVGHPLRQQLLKSELLPYQLDGIAFAVAAGRAILADEMGLGKTIQGIGVAELLARESGIARVLVITPTSLKSQWANEIARFGSRDSTQILGNSVERASQYRGDAFFSICNYEQVLRDIDSIEHTDWDLIILDEGQRIKNWEAKTSQTIKRLRSPFALVLTGTPLENRLDDLYSIVEFVDDRRLGPAFRFYNHHRVVDDKGRVLGYKNLDDLRRQLAPVLLRRTRASVLAQLPERQTEIVRIEPTAEQLDLHTAHYRIVSSIVRKPYLTEMDLLRLQKALLMCRRVANSTCLVDKQTPGYSSKLENLQRLLTQLNEEEGRKIVLFSEWTSMLDLIEPLVNGLAMDFVRLDGSVPQKRRQALVQRFQEQADCRLFMTTNAGATGLNLQAADTVINVDLPWNPALLEQRIARAHRMGQRRAVQVYILVTSDTLEDSLLATLGAKHELALAALDPDSDVTDVALSSGIEELKQRLEVLLGARPAAPEDASQRQKMERELSQQQRRQVAAAGGRMLTAAFDFIGELMPPAPEGEAQERQAAAIRESLSHCLQRNAEGELQLTVTLPHSDALNNLAQALAGLMAATEQQQGTGAGKKLGAQPN